MKIMNKHWIPVETSKRTLPGFSPTTQKIMLICLATNERFILKEPLREWTRGIWCTAARHWGPMFDNKGMPVGNFNGGTMIAVNYE